MNGVRSGVNGYRYCHDSYGVGPVMNNRRDGDYPTPSQFLRKERVVFYVPRLHYLGPDYFTYRIFDGPVVQPTGKVLANEVTIHVRYCRDADSSSRSVPHPLCSCHSDQEYAISDYSSCQEKVLALCSDPLTANIFTNLCQSCENEMIALVNATGTTTVTSASFTSTLLYSPLLPISPISSSCISQIIRAVSYVTESRLCDSEPVHQCRDEVNTNPGRESFNYLSLETKTLGFPFSLGREYTGTMFEEIYQSP
jgi:hypothetical protein